MILKSNRSHVLLGCCLGGLALGWVLVDEAPAEPQEPAEAEVGDAQTDAEADLGPPPELWFPVGEEIVYRVHWGRIRVGTTRITTDWIQEEGRHLLRIQFRTRSNRFLDRIYPVDSLIESIIDPGPFRPVRFVKRIREGRRRHDEVTTFDWEQGKARWVSLIREREEEFAIEPDTRCIPALMYYLRRVPLLPDSEYAYQVMADEKTYDVTVATGAYENVRLPRYGRVRSLKMEPTAAFDGVFVRSGRMWLWVAEDSRRVATRISAEVPVARVHLTLDRVRGPGSDFWVSGSDGGDEDDDEDG